MEIIRIDPVKNSCEWNDYILSKKGLYGIGHNPCLAFIFGQAFSYQAEYYVIKENNSIVGAIPGVRVKKKYISLPLFPTAGLISDNCSYDKVLHITGDYEIRDMKKVSEYCNNTKVTCHLKLEKDDNEQYNRFDSKLRSQIRKGYKNGIYSKYGGMEFLDSFYNVYLYNMHRLGSPALEKNFFKLLLENYEYGIAKIFLVFSEKKVVGGSILLSYGKICEVAWASTLAEYNKLNCNMVMYWEMIKYSVLEKYEVFSFGRATVNSNSHKFKIQWGVNSIPLYFNYSSKTFDIKKYKMLHKIWRRLPLSFVTKLGPLIRKKLAI